MYQEYYRKILKSPRNQCRCQGLHPGLLNPMSVPGAAIIPLSLLMDKLEFGLLLLPSSSALAPSSSNPFTKSLTLAPLLLLGRKVSPIDAVPEPLAADAASGGIWFSGTKRLGS